MEWAVVYSTHRYIMQTVYTHEETSSTIFTMTSTFRLLADDHDTQYVPMAVLKLSIAEQFSQWALQSEIWYQLNADLAQEIDTSQLHEALSSVSQGNSVTGPWPYNYMLGQNRLGRIPVIKAAQNHPARRLRVYRERADIHLATTQDYQEWAELESSRFHQVEGELGGTQLGRPHKSHGGNYIRKSRHGNSGSSSSQDQQLSNTGVPHFMKDYEPAPDADPPQEDDRPDVRRCTVGRPRGAVLRKGTYCYNVRLCDKHLSEGLFRENMDIHRSNQERTHAWRCSG
jgi:hypothetical protein